jgi:hypothetical protein
MVIRRPGLFFSIVLCLIKYPDVHCLLPDVLILFL